MLSGPGPLFSQPKAHPVATKREYVSDVSLDGLGEDDSLPWGDVLIRPSSDLRCFSLGKTSTRPEGSTVSGLHHPVGLMSQQRGCRWHGKGRAMGRGGEKRGASGEERGIGRGGRAEGRRVGSESEGETVEWGGGRSK